MKYYSGRSLERISFTLGGLGAGNICIRGNGALGDFCVRNNPGVGNDPLVYSAVTIPGRKDPSRIVESQVPESFISAHYPESGYGLGDTSFGLPRFTDGDFASEFPFAYLQLKDDRFPLKAKIKAWSPFIPTDEDDSSLPFAAIEYTFENCTSEPVDCVYYFAAKNFMRRNDDAFVRPVENGFVLEQPADKENCTVEGAFACVADRKAFIDTAWFRGGWFDAASILWKDIQSGKCENRSYADGKFTDKSGGTIAVPLHIDAFGSQSVTLRLCWYVPGSDIRDMLPEPEKAFGDIRDYHQPWYSCQYDGIDSLIAKWAEEYDVLKEKTGLFTRTFYSMDIPEELTEAIGATLSILKSPTVLRLRDGRFWAYEGSGDKRGSCPGTTTHVWNYQQAISHLFPALERSMREIEFFEGQAENGHQSFRVSIPEVNGDDYEGFHSAADGQLGGIVKVYRDWHISGDDEWLKKFWPQVRKSMDYCIATWDPKKAGAVTEAHHNTYDIEFWGPGGMCTGFYLSALLAACRMGEALGDDVSGYRELYEKGRDFMENELFNGEYFYQKTAHPTVEELKACKSFSGEPYSAELYELIEKEGPRYQYGTGCLSDAVLGIWLGEMSGLNGIIDEEKLRKCLSSIYKYNFKRDLSTHSNPQRPGYALGKEGGLLLCTWPRGGVPSLPFVYSNEVWTGIEYQVASHLISKGMTQEGIEIVRMLRSRYDGTKRNPYCEYECGYWYARAMASYALIQAYTGVWYDAVTEELHYKTGNNGSCSAFLSAANGFGIVKIENGMAEYIPAMGALQISRYVCDD